MPRASSTDPVIPGVRIPDLGVGEWKKAIDQWYRGDPAAGLKPLKDWEQREYKGRMRKEVATKRRTRELIAMAYEGCGRDDVAFLEAYPEASKTIRVLTDAIRRHQGLRRNSRSSSSSPSWTCATRTSSSSRVLVWGGQGGRQLGLLVGTHFWACPCITRWQPIHARALRGTAGTSLERGEGGREGGRLVGNQGLRSARAPPTHKRKGVLSPTYSAFPPAQRA